MKFRKLPSLSNGFEKFIVSNLWTSSPNSQSRIGDILPFVRSLKNIRIGLLNAFLVLASFFFSNILKAQVNQSAAAPWFEIEVCNLWEESQAANANGSTLFPNPCFNALEGTSTGNSPATAEEFFVCQGAPFSFRVGYTGGVSPLGCFKVWSTTNPSAPAISYGGPGPFPADVPMSNWPDWTVFQQQPPGNNNVFQKTFNLPGTYYLFVFFDEGCVSNGVRFGQVATKDGVYVKITVLPGFAISAPPVCKGDQVTLTANGCLVNQAFFEIQNTNSCFSNYLTWSTGAINTNTVTIPNAQPGQQVSLTYTTCYEDYYGNIQNWTFTEVYTLDVFNQAKPVVLGPTTTCDGSPLTYTIGNYSPSSLYTITSGFGTPSSVNSQGQFTVSFSGAPPPVFTVTVTETARCATFTEIDVASCCQGSPVDGFQPIVLDNQTISSQFPTGLVNYQGQVVLNGTIQVDINTTFLGAKVKMAPNARVVVVDGVDLTIDASTFDGQECNYYWDGIYVGGVNSKVEIKNNSTIRDAEVGLHLTEHPEVIVRNSNFINNKQGITFNNFSFLLGSPPTGLIQTIITGNQFYNSGTKLQPYTAATVFGAGIWAKRSNNVYVGVLGQPINNFHDLANGFYGTNVDAHLFNNHFESTQGSSVRVWNDGSISFPKNYFCNLELGGVNKGNTFKGNSPHGVYSLGLTRINATWNTFQNHSIVLPNIWVREVHSGSKVSNNQFQSGSGQIPNNNHYAIKLEKVMPSGKGTQLEVKENNIKNYRGGIWLRNIHGYGGSVVAFQSRRPHVYLNTIEVIPATNAQVGGIYIEGSNAVSVQSNDIKRIPSTSSSIAQSARGIIVSQTQNALITDNIITNFGSGIWSAGYLLGTQYLCNTPKYNFHGFFFLPNSPTSNTVISSQGSPTNTTENNWFDPNSSIIAAGGSRFGGSTDQYNNPEWHYSMFLNTTDANFDNSLFSIASPVPQNGAPSNQCQPMFRWQNPNEIFGYRDEELELLLQNEIQYQTLVNEFNQYGREYLWELLNQVNELLSLGTISDQDFQNWFNDMSQSNFGQFKNVQALIDTGDYAGAFLANAQIPEETPLDAARKTANHVFLSQFVYGGKVSESDSSVLYAIAELTPYQKGAAVFSARAMLAMDADELGASYRTVANENEEIEPGLLVYPNPARGQWNVDLEGLEEITDIRIFSLSGAIQTKAQVERKGLRNFAVNGLSPGTYVVEAHTPTRIVRHKVIVMP
jgi:hypothetical protein